ncbi:MAG: hypothetical protein U9N45_00940, partial [Gemmatimonadota bacterium]|nr:hypothetical protein [Gemmatimonadota bacterium]
VVNPWVTTDKSVNCYNEKTIIADLTAGPTGPQDKAIAVFSFFQRAMFPYTNRSEYPFPKNDQQHHFDFVRMVNVYGYALCTQTSAMFASLLQRSGIVEDARCVGVPGHGTAEVKWGGRWHFMDPIVGAFVFRRDREEIASIQDIAADTTLMTRAVEEGRASMPFCPWDAGPVYPLESLAQKDVWFTYRAYGLDFLLGALPEPDPWEETVTITHEMSFNLRPGFRLTRMWDHLPGMYNLSYEYFRQPFNSKVWTPSPAILPPHQPDGGEEASDTLNWPVIKPYRKTINGHPSYHYWANGIMAYEDIFTDSRIFRSADSVTGLEVADGMLRCAASGGGKGEGEAVFRFEAPYIFVGGTVKVRAQVADGSWTSVCMDLGGEEEVWMTLGVIEKGGDHCFEIPAHFLRERYDFRLKLKLHDESGAGSVNLRELKAEAVCQLNMYSLPFLAPGENEVTVSAGRIPRGTSLAVTYRWQEQGWLREHCRVVKTPGESYNITVAGDEYPRMREITLECIPE